MKCTVYEMSGLWSVWSMNCPIYEMSGLWNVRSMKCPVYKMSGLWNVRSMKCLVYEMSVYEMSVYELSQRPKYNISLAFFLVQFQNQPFYCFWKNYRIISQRNIEVIFYRCFEVYRNFQKKCREILIYLSVPQ